MKNKILVVIFIAAIGIWKFQDKIFQYEAAPTPPIDSVKEKATTPAPSTANTPVTVDLVISDKSFKEQFSQPHNFPKLLEGLNSHFNANGIEIKPSFSFYEDYSAIPAEKYEAQIVITQAATLVNLIKEGKEYTPLYYVSPNPTSCYKEVQIISLLDSGIGSVKDIDGKRLILSNLKHPSALALRRFIEESGINPLNAIIEDDRDRYISKLTNKEADAAILYTGYLTSKDPAFALSRFLYTTDYKYPCFVMYATKTVPIDLLERFKTVMEDILKDPEYSKNMLLALGIKNFEPATTESWTVLTNDMKKYVMSEVRAYVPPPPPPTPIEPPPPTPEVVPEPPKEDPKQVEMQQKLEQQMQQQQQQIQQQMQQMQQMQQQIQQQQLRQQQQQQQQKPADGSPQQQLQTPQYN